VRIPAAWCGLTGLKTTISRISAYGVLPLSPTQDTPGPIIAAHEGDRRDPFSDRFSGYVRI
jgi:aspartyl-tRNA(Asn)/glutamyl-tRNA(Gln) amidotransferase subunit A